MTTSHENIELFEAFIAAMSDPLTYRQNPVLGQGLRDLGMQSDTTLKLSHTYGSERIRQFLRESGGYYVDEHDYPPHYHRDHRSRDHRSRDYAGPEEDDDGAARGGGAAVPRVPAGPTLESSLEAVSNVINFRITESAANSAEEFYRKTSYVDSQADIYAAHIIGRVTTLNRNLYPHVAKFIHALRTPDIRRNMVEKIYASLSSIFSESARLKELPEGDLAITEDDKRHLYLLGQLIVDSQEEREEFVARIIGCFLPSKRSQALIIVMMTILNDYKKDGLFSEAMRTTLSSAAATGGYDRVSRSHISSILHVSTA